MTEPFANTYLLEDYLTDVMNYHGGTQRRGQFAFNLLCDERPDLSEQIRGVVGLDPFFSDDLSFEFVNFLYENWNVTKVPPEVYEELDHGEGELSG